MTWVVKDMNDEYLVRFERGLYTWEARDWCMDQSFAYRFDNRNLAAQVARVFRAENARVVKLTPSQPSSTEKP